MQRDLALFVILRKGAIPYGIASPRVQWEKRAIALENLGWRWAIATK